MREAPNASGRVVEILPNSEVKVELKDGTTIRCYLAGKLKINRIRLLIGDFVDVVRPAQSVVGRVVFRR